MTTSFLALSKLPHTWILDVDGTIVKHNGYKIDGYDTLLPDVKSFFAQIPDTDMIILLTSRTEDYRLSLEKFLKNNGLRYDILICGAPMGERILINDTKPRGLTTAYAVSKSRDSRFDIKFILREDL